MTYFTNILMTTVTGAFQRQLLYPSVTKYVSHISFSHEFSDLRVKYE